MAAAPKNIGIIGGGYTGLTAALRLAQAGHNVTVWERGKLGGQAATMPLNGTHIEIFYHHLFQSDVHIQNLSKELGLEGELMWLPSDVAYFADGRILPLNGAFDLLRLNIIPIWDRIRVGLVTLWLQRQKDWKKYENITAHDWLTRAIGENAYKKTFGAQLKAKFGRYYDRVSMVWFWGKIYLRTTSRENPVEQEKLGYFKDSFKTFSAALVEACRDAGVTLVEGTGIENLEQTDSGAWHVQTSSGTDEKDVVLATTPSTVFQKLVPNLPAEYTSRLNALEYEGAIVTLLELDHQVTDTYWLNIADDDMPFTAVVEHTNFVGPDKYQGSHLVYLSKYVEQDHPYFDLSDDQIFAEYLPHLRKLNPDFEESWIKNRWMFRERAAQPIPPLNYSEKIPDLKTPLDNLWLANTTQIYPEDRGTNYAVRLGEDVSKRILKDIETR